MENKELHEFIANQFLALNDRLDTFSSVIKEIKDQQLTLNEPGDQPDKTQSFNIRDYK